MRNERQILLRGLAEPDPRIDDDALGGDAMRPRDGDPIAKKLSNFKYDVVVGRRELHGARARLHVHQTNRTIRRLHNAQRFARAQGFDIVDAIDAERERRLHDLGATGIDRNRHP